MRISDWSSDVCSSDLLPCDHVAPVAGEEGARGLFPLIEPQRADQRFDHVGGDIVAMPPAVADRLRAKTDMRVEIEGLGDARAGLSRGQGVQTRRQFALPRLGETAEQLRHDDKPAQRSEARRGGKERGSTW